MTEQLSEDHRDLLKAALEQKRMVESNLAFVQAVLAAKYNLKATDSVNEDGTIVRKASSGDEG